MEKKLSHQQIEEIKKAYLKDNLSIENQIVKLIIAGYDENTAERLINEVVKDYKRELFKNAQEESKDNEIKKITTPIIILATILGPVINIVSSEWYIFATIIASIAGYYDLKKQPIAGVIRSVVLVILFPLAFKLYISKRNSYITIELLIPFFISLLIAYLFQIIISRIFYSNDND